MTKGFIYKFTKPKGRHPFIFVKSLNHETFVGCMITHADNSEEFAENISMRPEHFKVFKKEGLLDKYLVQYDSSNLVRRYLIKKSSEVGEQVWGELTSKGIKFLELEITNINLTYWSEK